MSKKNKKSAAPKSVKTALFSIIPVLSAILLIFVVGLVVILVKNLNDKKPTFKGAEDVYFEYGEMSVTKDELYTNLKIQYGAAELIRLIDEKLYAEELAASKKLTDEKKDDDLVLYILDSLFQIDSKEKLGTDEEHQKSWDELIESLEMNNLITAEEIGDEENQKVTNLDSTVWGKVKDHYRLQYVRNSWAKDAYVEQWKEEKLAQNAEDEVENPDELFTEKELQAKYDALYEAKTYGLFIPFTSEASAKAMMARYGINTQNVTSINQDGWMSSDYDYYKGDQSASAKDKHRLTNEQVLDIFYKMYNEVYAHYANGNTIIANENIDNSINHKAAFNEAVYELNEALKKFTVKGTITLPTTVTVKDGIDITINWQIVENDYVALTENKLTLKSTETATKGGFDLKATLSLVVDDKLSYTETLEFDCQSEVKAEAEDETISLPNIQAYVAHTLSKEFMDSFEGDKQANEYSKFVWTASELSAIDSQLSSYLKAAGKLEPILNNEAHADFYKSYTVAPVKGSNFYFLMIKFEEVEEVSLDSVKNELVEKLLEDLKTDNNASKMIYERRTNAEFKIYDKYLEAIYEYDYKTFFETTLKLTNYQKFETSKKNQKYNVASVKINGKEEFIKAEELYNSLEDKYGVSIIVDFINTYETVIDNPYYNPYTDKVLNKKVVEELFEGEVSSFRNNFELDYFTYSYLAYYGFIPNFPGSYGWNDFRKDYFGAYSDKALLTNASFGGYIYTDALDALKEKVYLNAYNEEHKDAQIATYDELMIKLIKDQVEVIEKEHYSLTLVNLIISLDKNYDGSADSPLEDGLWSENDVKLAEQLAELLYEKAPETLKTTLADQLAAIVKEYNDADLNDAVWGKYKAAGLFAKAESANTYTNTSNIVEEFADEISKMWDEIESAGLLGVTFDAPLLSTKPFATSYGYHHIAVLGTTEVTPLAEKDAQIEINYALTQYNAIKDNTYSFVQDEKAAKKAALEAVLAKYGYNLELSKKENLTDAEKETLAESKADFLEKYGFDIDTLAFNTDTQKVLKTYYDAAITEIESGDEMTNFTLGLLKAKVFDFKDADTKDARNAQLQKIVEVTEKKLAEEAEEGANK